MDALRECTSAHSVRKTLQEFPRHITDVYQQTWDRIHDQAPENARIAMKVLIWILCAKEPLQIDLLRQLIALCPGTYQVDRSRLVDIETLLGLCRGLVYLEGETDK